MGRLLSIDYGLKRVGIAVTDPLRIIASPLETIPAATLFIFLQDYLKAENVDEIIIGLPKNLKNNDTHITEDVRKIVIKLENTFPNVPIKTVDERFTSAIASQTILSAGIGKMKRRDKKLVDKVSASLILQTYMEMNK